MFVISRALQGVGAASTVPAAMAVIATNYAAGPERTKAFSIFGAFSGLGAVAGILMAGGLVSSVGWQWIFRVSSLASYLLFALGFLTIPPSPSKREQPKIDYMGAITATFGVTGITYYISTGTQYGWASPKTLPVFLVSLTLLALFIFIETKVESPLMPLQIWSHRTFSTSVVLGLVSMAMTQGVIFYVNMVFQEVYGWVGIQTALGFLAHALLVGAIFPILGRFMSQLRMKPLIMIGFLLRTVTGLMFAFVNEGVSYFRLPFPALILHIFGVAFTLLPIQITAFRDAESKDHGLVGAIYNAGLQLGGPFGIAILNVVVISTNGKGNGDGGVEGGPASMKGYRNAFFGTVAMGLFGFVLAMIILPWDRPLSPGSNARMKKMESPEIKDSEAATAAAATAVDAVGAQETFATSVRGLELGFGAESDANTIVSETDH
ncbi:major facilitator superfamily domain-containing protein [Dissophora ornata]|nr:hypothetical protein BGZ58_007138 [Dissophora ornata]KAI8602176.1 major facilitator superfamily domain-containing protein [Dissophora ornata]